MKKGKADGSTFIRISVTTRDRLRKYCEASGRKMGPFADASILEALVRAGLTSSRKRAS